MFLAARAAYVLRFAGLIMLLRSKFLLPSAILLLSAGLADAQERRAWWSGDWYVSLGASVFSAPKYEGGSSNKLQWSPLISFGKQGPDPRFTSRNDSASFSLYDQGAFRAGLAGRFIPKRDADTDSDLRGLKPVKWGVEAGAFAEVYPTDWLRARAELRQGIRAHSGLVADTAIDAYVDILPELRLSGGPRATWATEDYFETYYGVNQSESAASGLSTYNPGGGLKSVGAGAALTWQATPNITASSFVEYKRLEGPAADSSLVRERGDPNQWMIGVSASYKFNFTLN